MTSIDLTHEIVHEVKDPETGEIIARTDLPAVARLWKKVDDVQRQWKDVKAWANQAIIDYLDAQAKWTIEAGGLKVSAPSPEAADVHWDLDELAKLEALLPSERYAELVRQTVILEPQTGELHKAAKAGGRIAEIIMRAESRTPKRRYARVSRA